MEFNHLIDWVSKGCKSGNLVIWLLFLDLHAFKMLILL